MKKQINLTILSFFFFTSLLIAQNASLEGYVFEDNNRGYLNEVIIKIYDASSETFVTETISSLEGLFTASLPAGKEYVLKASKDLFFTKEEILSTKGKNAGEKVYSKIKMERKPGYIFDVTLAESGAPTATVDAITGAKIEVYNNTKLEETLVIDSLEGINFDVTFERGNHYTVLIRKEGYFNKRLEAYVDVEGCILCFEGVGTVTPGVSDVMSEGFQMGSVLANIELEPARLNRTMKIDNIYYDLDKYDIRPDAALELDKVVELLNENPTVIIELGSHTDSRGGTRYNKKLSSQRAAAAVAYIIKNGGISKTRITSKGYGEAELVNKCLDGIKCSEEEHQENRRTELKIIGFEEVDPLAAKSLADMLTEKRLLEEVQNSEQIQIAPGQVPDFDKKTKPKSKSQKETKTTPSTEETKAQIKSVPSNQGETLVEKGQSKITANRGSTDAFTFDQSQVLVVQNGQMELMDKMIGNQLNTKVTDKLLGKKILVDGAGGMKVYQFDAIDKMPVPLLNIFLKKLAMLETKNNWQLFPMEEKTILPKKIMEALK